MTSMSSTLANYTDLKEVSATLDKLKENALKKINSINDIRDDEYKKDLEKNIEYAMDSNIYNNYMINQKTTHLKKDVFFDDYDHQNDDTYDLFKNDASKKSKHLNDVFEYDFVNTDGCIYNEYPQLHEGPHTKQYGRSCSNQFENIQEDNHQESVIQHNSYNLSVKITNELNEMDDIYTHEDFRNSNEQLFEFMHFEQLDSNVKWNSRNLGDIQEDQNHYMPNEPQNYPHSKNKIEQINREDEETMSSTNDVANQDKDDDFKYKSSLYSCNSMQNNGSIGNYSNDSTDKETCNSEMNREPMQENDISLHNSYAHMDNDMKSFSVDGGTSIEIKREKMQVFLDNDIFSTNEAQKAKEDKNIEKNCEINFDDDIQKMNKNVHNNIVQKLSDHYEQRNKKIVEDEKQNGLYHRYSNETCSNLKSNEYNDRQHGDRERSSFKNKNMHTRVYNKINNRFVRRRFEDFKGRRKINDRDISSHTRKCGFQDFRKYAYNSTPPRQHMFSRKSNFNDERYNMSHARYINGLYNLRDSRKRNRFSQGINSFNNAKTREKFNNVSQQSSLSIHKEVPQIHYPRKRLRRSISPDFDEDDKPFHKDNHISDTEKSPTKGFSDCRYRRFGPGSSGLGGYSPRRRRSETAIKTPSPQPRSPDRQKTKAWDMVPEGIDNKVVGAIAASHSAQQVVAKQVSTLSSISPLVSMNIVNSTNNLNVSSNSIFPSILPSILHHVNPPLTTVTLTQATRSIRRLYVGNVPSTVSDGELMEFMNAAMLSANANYIPGTKPCINCIVNIEKAYAFAEFITPEDATIALGFDGVTLHGTILKIRRPKDFIAPEHGGCPIAQPTINLVANVVLDSPQKIFVGGISSLLTPEKVKEIVTAFGQLKSFHWKTMDHKGCCMAFLEYLDPMVTHQACVGLNGMHLGGQVLTVLQATPNAKYEVFSSNPPFYDIPVDALPLLETPTNIIKLYNLISEDKVYNMEDDEVKELMEDVRFECRRFGNIRSMQLIKPPSLPIAAISTVCNNTKSEEVRHLVESNINFSNDENKSNVSSLQIINQIYGLQDNMGISPLTEGGETHNFKDCDEEQVMNSTFMSLEDVCKYDCKEKNISLGVDCEYGYKEDKSLEVDCKDGYKEEEISLEGDCEDGCKEDNFLSKVDCGYNCKEEKVSLKGDYEHVCKEDKVSSEIDCRHVYKEEKITSALDCGNGCKEEKTSLKINHGHGSKEENQHEEELVATLNSLIPNTNNLCDSTSNLIELEPLKMGHIYVEYSREESACQAAHALRGRTFGQKKVEVVYVLPQLYFKYFGKGLKIQSLEEKKILSLEVQKHLTTHIKD